jgi:methylthioribulose-1-phosphate dehydratase
MDHRYSVIAAARQFYQLGWMFGTAGNLSARTDDGSFWITASGKQKGRLRETDFVRVSGDGEVLESPDPQNRPSAEISIHQAIYHLFPEAQACYHVHSVEANLVSSWATGNCIVLPPIEMLKGFDIWEENPQVALSLFENHANVPRIAQEIRDRFSTAPPDVPALLIRHHGVTVWASSPVAAQNRIEIAEYLFRYLLQARQFSQQSIVISNP